MHQHVAQGAEDPRLAQVEGWVRDAVARTPITDIHTHLFAPVFGGLLLWGPDDLITYHYLVAEAMRWLDIPYERFWALSKSEQAELIWQTLFIDHSPISEACRGVLTVFNRLGLDYSQRDLNHIRSQLAGTSARAYTQRILSLSNVESVAMTNDPFDPVERTVWMRGEGVDPQFRAVLRIDPLLNDWTNTCEKLSGWGYEVDQALSVNACKEVRRFLVEWIERMKPLYMAVSLPPDFTFPDQTARTTLIKECLLPVSRAYNVPLALMIGVRRQVNPALRVAGDAAGQTDVSHIERLCAEYPQNKFLVTLLARENQHELVVAARKFRNLMIFGCWWFLNNPSLITEITEMRVEMLGLSMIPQHSDARVLDQLLYKWDHSRAIIADVLVRKYRDLAQTGWPVSQQEVQRDVTALFGGNFWHFLERSF